MTVSVALLTRSASCRHQDFDFSWRITAVGGSRSEKAGVGGVCILCLFFRGRVGEEWKECVGSWKQKDQASS